MTKYLLLVVALVACKANTDNLPIGVGGGGGGGGGGGRPDAPADTGVGSNSNASGRVCLLTAEHDLSTCAATGALGLRVTLGTLETTTAYDGTFTLGVPTGSGLVWHVTGANFVTSVKTYIPGDTTIPIMTVTMFNDDVEADTGDFQLANTGGIFVHVTSGGAGLSGATVAPTPQAAYDTAYDGTTVHGWTTVATGVQGTAFVGGEAVGTATISATPSGGGATSVSGIPVEDGALTYLTFSL